jgi:hypothetical protein
MIQMRTIKNRLIMKLAALGSLILFSVHGKSQLESVFVAKKMIPTVTVEPNSFLPLFDFITEKGEKKRLSDYNGKIIYITIWSTSCAPCIGQLPYQEQLLKRLKALHLDSSVVLININIKDAVSTWRKALQKHKPAGINVHCSDKALYNDWKIDELPFHVLLGSSGNILGMNIVGPGEGTIDWLLYSATKKKNLVEATWTQYAQNKLMEKHRSSAAFTDQEYANWFRQVMPSLIEFDKWRQQQKSNNSHKATLP